VRRRVFVTGASGQLGTAIVAAFSDADICAPSHAELDITSVDRVASAVAEARPGVVVNCAAFNDVDGAEARPFEAFGVNALAVRGLARAAEAVGATFVHFGTDFVFDGEAIEPYSEDSPPVPRSTYAASKLVGDWFALDAPRAFVLRVESLFGIPPGWTGRRGSLDTIVAGLEEGRSVRVFSDRVVSPAYVHDVAAAARFLVQSDAAPGVYHCVNSGHATWEAIAREAARILDVEPRLETVVSGQAGLKASRPRFSALSPARLAAAGHPMPTWQDALRRSIAERSRLEASSVSSERERDTRTEIRPPAVE
jgi:dTDP-4-dehydrorhamnose reductase